MALWEFNNVAWACPDNLVDCAPGGFNVLYDSVDGNIADNPRRSCATAASGIKPSSPWVDNFVVAMGWL
jgi:hypothetical protein